MILFRIGPDMDKGSTNVRNHMGGGGSALGMMLHGLVSLAILAALIVAAIIIVKKLKKRSGGAPLFTGFVGQQAAAPVDPQVEGLRILNERLAKGEIEIDDYYQRRSALQGPDPQKPAE